VTSGALLAADCVGKSYDGRRVLSSASLRAVPGQVRALMGRNGSGKTTLLRIAAGLMEPDTGHVSWEGRAAQWRLPALAERGLFFVPDHDLLSPAFTLRRQLEMMRRQFGGEDSLTAASRVGLAARLDQRVSALSGGELRRAELALAVARAPRCLLADEPFRGVAPVDAEWQVAIFRAFAQAGTAVVISGHEVHTLLDAADHVTWCTSGTTYELGASDAARRDERFHREYLGTPSLALRNGAA